MIFLKQHNAIPHVAWTGFAALLLAGCASIPDGDMQENDLHTYLGILRTRMDWSLPGLAAAKTALDANDTETACAELLAYYRQRAQPEFFFQSEDITDIVSAIQEDLPASAAKLVQNADRIVERKFPNSTSRTVVYRVALPEDFSWTGNPTEDPEFRHMLQRSRFWQDLAFGYAMTGNKRYAETFATQITSWLRNVPLPTSGWGKPRSPWWRTINAGIRGDTWLWAYAIFLHSPAMTPELHAQILGAVAEHGRLLRHHHKAPTGNWCVMEMQGLLNIAIMFPELKEAASWRNYGRDMLVTSLQKQIRPDGVHIEQSPNYHKGCIRWFLEPMLLAGRNGIAFPPEYRQTLSEMGEFALWATDPQGRTVALSDSDREVHTRMVLTSLAAALDRPELAWYRDVSPWHYWLFGVDKARQLYDMRHTTPAGFMRVFSDAGYVFGRSDWSPEGRYFVFDCGPRGRGHGHLDLLTIEIHGFGEMLIADPGRWLYGDDPLRKEIISTPAHNTISLDDQSHDTVEDRRRGTYELVAAEQHDGWMYVHGRHRAYRSMAGPPLIERRIWFDGDAMWIVLDSVRAPEIHDLRQTWQFATTGVVWNGSHARVGGSQSAGVALAVSDAPQQR
ncbi:MAG: heparinase II/III family protein, partial [Candidatus Hydrogenedentota bacterium]